MQTLDIDIERVLNTFLEMVRIDSPSGAEEPMRHYLEKRLETLGLTYRVDEGGNLICDVPKYDCKHDTVLLLTGHMDVVPPCNDIQPVVEGSGDERIVYSDNTTVLGADDKSGLAPILEMVALSLKENLPRPNLRLVFTTREEVGLAGAKELPDDVLEAGFAVTLDHTGEQGTIIHQAPSYIKFVIECLGKSVHAGIMPEKGVNAITFASRIIERLHLGRLDEETTANLGFINGGKATNVVPDNVVIQGEMRSLTPEKLTKELAYIAGILEEEKAKFPGADYKFSHAEEFRAYRIEPNHPGIQLVAEAAKKSGLTPKLISTKGGSDNNIFVARGLSGVVLSAGFIEPHSLKERVQVGEMRQCCEFLLNILEVFARHDILSA